MMWPGLSRTSGGWLFDFVSPVSPSISSSPLVTTAAEKTGSSHCAPGRQSIVARVSIRALLILRRVRRDCNSAAVEQMTSGAWALNQLPLRCQRWIVLPRRWRWWLQRFRRSALKSFVIVSAEPLYDSRRRAECPSSLCLTRLVCDSRRRSRVAPFDRRVCSVVMVWRRSVWPADRSEAHGHAIHNGEWRSSVCRSAVGWPCESSP